MCPASAIRGIRWQFSFDLEMRQHIVQHAQVLITLSTSVARYFAEVPNQNNLLGKKRTPIPSLPVTYVLSVFHTYPRLASLFVGGYGACNKLPILE